MSKKSSTSSTLFYIICSIIVIIIGYTTLSYISKSVTKDINITNAQDYSISTNINIKIQEPAKFGTILGWTSTIIPTPAFSCDYATSTLPGYYLNSTSYSNYVVLTKDNQYLYTGIKYQCVEFSRRFLILNYGITYESIEYAYNIFDLKNGINVYDNTHVSIETFRNGNVNRPKLGDLLIWNKSDDVITGHVAVVLDVSDTYVHLAEQNYDDFTWPEGQKYARSLSAEIDANSNYFINDPNLSNFLGWVRFGESLDAA